MRYRVRVVRRTGWISRRPFSDSSGRDGNEGQKVKLEKDIEASLRDVMKSPEPSSVELAERVRGLLSMIFSPQTRSLKKLDLEASMLRQQPTKELDQASLFPPVSHHSVDSVDITKRSTGTRRRNPPSRTLYFGIELPSLLKSDFVRLLRIDPAEYVRAGRAEKAGKSVSGVLERLQFEFWPRRDHELIKRPGYYLEFRTVADAQDFRNLIAGSNIFLMPASSFAEFVPDSELQAQKDNYAKFGIEQGQRHAVILHNVPHSVHPSEIEARLGDVNCLSVEPVSRYQGRVRYVVKTASREDSLRIKLRLHGNNWDKTSTPIYVEFVM